MSIAHCNIITSRSTSSLRTILSAHRTQIGKVLTVVVLRLKYFEEEARTLKGLVAMTVRKQ